eukprot:453978-Prymnesium_polylepis.1
MSAVMSSVRSCARTCRVCRGGTDGRVTRRARTSRVHVHVTCACAMCMLHVHVTCACAAARNR